MVKRSKILTSHGFRQAVLPVLPFRVFFFMPVADYRHDYAFMPLHLVFACVCYTYAHIHDVHKYVNMIMYMTFNSLFPPIKQLYLVCSIVSLQSYHFLTCIHINSFPLLCQCKQCCIKLTGDFFSRGWVLAVGLLGQVVKY